MMLVRKAEAYIRVRRSIALLPRRFDVSRRMLPTLIILGAQRGGTTSLFHYVTQHPQVQRAVTKEIHYFDLNFSKGLSWYRAHFPRVSHGLMTLDVSPYYIFHPEVPRRLKAVLPEAKFVVLLRNPVERSHSHYWHMVKRGYERLSFSAALAEEDNRLRGETERLQANARYVSFTHRNYSYLSRGFYAEQIERWFESFSPEQFLFIKSETFFADPAAETGRVFHFLNLDGHVCIHDRIFNKNHYGAMDPSTHHALTKYYRPFNRRLAELLGQDITWDEEK